MKKYFLLVMESKRITHHLDKLQRFDQTTTPDLVNEITSESLIPALM